MTTVKKQLSIVTAPLKFAAANHWIPADPTVGIRIPSSTHIKKPAKEIVVFEGDSYDKLRAVLETEAHDAYCAALLMIEMGLRPGEAIALDWDDVLWNKKAVHIRKTYVRDTKTGGWFVQNEPKTKASNRIIPMSTYAHDMLERLYEKRGPHDSCVFRSVDGVRMSYESLRYQIARACEKANVSYEGMHVFRHTFATRQYYKGTSVKILSKLLGHASVTVTYNVYIHLYGDALDEMRSVLD